MGLLTLDIPLLLLTHHNCTSHPSSDYLLYPALLGYAGAAQALRSYAVDETLYPGYGKLEIAMEGEDYMKLRCNRTWTL